MTTNYLIIQNPFLRGRKIVEYGIRDRSFAFGIKKYGSGMRGKNNLFQSRFIGMVLFAFNFYSV